MSVTAFILWLLAMAMPVAAHAGSARMELDIAPGVTAEADYWPGEADMPAVLILHGFLQTSEFPTVRRLAESLAEEGFSVLTPSLTLGLNRRRQSPGLRGHPYPFHAAGRRGTGRLDRLAGRTRR